MTSSTLNGYRSAIASVLTVIHPKEVDIAQLKETKELFKAKRRSEVIIKTPTQLESWDVSMLVAYIKITMPLDDTLDLFNLQQKVVLLLCIHTMWRPRSDIGRIQYRDVLAKDSPSSGEIEGVTIQVREPKETQSKHITLGYLPQDNKYMCVVTSLLNFIQRTLAIRENLPMDHTLLLKALNQEDIKIIGSTQPATLSSWLKTHMQKAGVDESYKPHSIRSATSTKAVVQGIPIQKVKEHANWSLNSDTSEKYYYKPPMHMNSSTQVQNSIFNTENHTTSESEFVLSFC